MRPPARPDAVQPIDVYSASPGFLATMGVAAAWLGVIEGVSDGLSSFAKMGSGYYTDKLQKRKPIAVAGYVLHNERLRFPFIQEWAARRRTERRRAGERRR